MVRQGRADIANQVLFDSALSQLYTTNDLCSRSSTMANHRYAIHAKQESASEGASRCCAHYTSRRPRIAVRQSDLVRGPSRCAFDTFQNYVPGEPIGHDDLRSAAASDIETFNRTCINQAPSCEYFLQVGVCFNAQLVALP
jgi:hypothetical protein